MIASNQRNWCDMVPYVAYAYNIATHSATTYSPFCLMFGREAKTNLNNLLEIPDDERERTPDSYAKEVAHNLAQAYDIVCDELQCKFEKAKQCYDAPVKSVQFKEGQFVWYYCPRRKPGLNPKWTNRNSGPHLIVRMLNLVNYVIKFTAKGSKLQTVHIDKLTPYLGDVSADWRKQQDIVLQDANEAVPDVALDRSGDGLDVVIPVALTGPQASPESLPLVNETPVALTGPQASS